MLDPGSALSVATATLQFLDFSLKTLEICREIRDDAQGATAANSALEAATTELTSILNDLQTKSASNATRTGRRIGKVATDCLGLANDLVHLLEEIRGASRKKHLGTANATFKALRGNKRIEKLRNALKEKLATLDTVVTHDIHARLQQLEGKQDVHFTSLFKQYNNLLGVLQRQQQATTQSLQVIDQSLSTVKSQNYRIEEAIHKSKNAIGQDLKNMHSHVSQQLDTLQSQKARTVLFQSLFYPEHELRRATVSSPSLRTFDWIFEEDVQAQTQASKGATWSPFLEWLRSGTSLYWISGKAASGKSTLVAHITNHSTTRSNLEIWAGNRLLHILCYFFWRPGSALQKNVQGLLRSILLQILSEIPSLTELLTSEFFLTADTAPVWTTKQLVAMLERSLQLASRDQRCFGIFLDGLDEFEGDIDELFSLIFSLQRQPYVKCCISSRPEAHLKYHLSGCATLRLEELNYNDIVLFVENKLNAYEAPIDFVHRIADRVGNLANGVFLWAAITTQSVIRGLTSHDGLDLLLRRLDTYPSDMDELFKRMLQDVDEVHKDSLGFFLRARMMFSRHSSPGADLTLVLLTASQGHNPLGYESFVEMCEQTEKQIVAQSRGLLEVHTYHNWVDDLEVPILTQSRNGERARQTHACNAPEQNARHDTAVSLRDPDHRQRVFCTRRLVGSNPVTERLLELQETSVQWVHRCAFDFMLLHETDWINKFLNDVSESEVARRLVDASLKTFVALPWFDCSGIPYMFDDHTMLHRLAANTYGCYLKCYSELFTCMNYTQEHASAGLRELETLLDGLDFEALRTHDMLDEFAKRAVPIRSPPAFSGYDVRAQNQYHRELWKSFIWGRAFSSRFFSFANSAVPRVAQYEFGAIMLATLIGEVHLDRDAEDGVLAVKNIFERLEDTYLRGMKHFKEGQHDCTTLSIPSTTRLSAEVSWRPYGYSMSGELYASEDMVVSLLNAAFLRWVVGVYGRGRTCDPVPVTHFSRVVGPLLPYLRGWDCYYSVSINSSRAAPLVVHISHHNVLLSLARQASASDDRTEIEEFSDAFRGRVRVCFNERQQQSGFEVASALSPSVTEQLVDLFTLSINGSHTPEFVAMIELVRAILRESAEREERNRDLALACLYTFPSWRDGIPPEATSSSSKRSKSLNDVRRHNHGSRIPTSGLPQDTLDDQWHAPRQRSKSL